MSLWASIYLGVIILSALYSIRLFRFIRWFWLGELLSLTFVIAFFLFYYEKMALPADFVWIFLMGAYILYWELWVNRHLISAYLGHLEIGSGELLITLLITFFPLFYIMTGVGLRYF